MNETCVVDGKLYEAEPSLGCAGCAGNDSIDFCNALAMCDRKTGHVIWVPSSAVIVEPSSAPYNMKLIAVGMGIPEDAHHAFCLGFEDGHCDGQADPEVSYVLPEEQRAYLAGVDVAKIVTRGART